MIRTAQDSGHAMAENMSSIKAELIGAGYYDTNRNFVKVRLQGAPRIGVSPRWWSQPFAPFLNWDVTVELTRNAATGATNYKVTGGHDGFPFHDIRIGGTPVWERDPIRNGDTPQALYGDNDVQVSKQGTL